MKSIQVQDLGRIQEIARVLAKNGFGHAFSVIGITNLPAGDPEIATKPYARRARQALIDLGPTYVKLGQVLSVRPDILPPDVLTEFATLQDKVPPLGIQQVRAAITQELGRPLEDVFSSLEETPLGSASIAQVHRAVLKDGREVAVKLQRPNIEKKIQSDLAILYSLARALEGRVEIPGFYTPVAIVREFDQAITRELDFLDEASASARMRRNFSSNPDVLIPEIFDEYTTRRLLVMELVKGEPLSVVMKTAKASLQRRIAHKLMEATYQQVFEHGFFHGDPHPGNILLTEDERLAFLDFGVTGLLTGHMQDTIISAFTSLVFRDAETLAMTVYRAGATAERVDLRAFRDDMEFLMVKYHGVSLDQLSTRATLVDVFQLASTYRINLPSEYAVLSRAVTLIEGICRGLLPGIDIVEEVTPYAQRLMRKRFSPERVAGDAAKLIIQAQGHMRELPTQLSQVLMDLEAGNVSFVTKDPEAELLREEIRMGAMRISLGLLASTTTMGAVIFLAAWSPAPLGVPVFGLIGFLILGIGIGLFGALGVHVLFAGLLSPAAWRRRIVGLFRFFRWRRRAE
ncbi:MAG: AarF/ABC1/UbiB kinase family protein [Deltaproteobacteria bacterium]|nr:MAG: AarF/ABC1/UbiB kinase family protein [Deltaproteobacteria bacterium]